MRLKMALATTLAVATAAGADDIFKGMRGPTNWQADGRVSYAQNEKGATNVTNTAILKYWDGDGFGKWAFASVSYRFVAANNGQANGFGDITIGAGPRGRIGNLHQLFYGALTFPTGDSGFVPALGNGRYDTRLGCFVTYLSPDKSFDIDGSVEYNITGTNHNDVNVPNEISAGAVAGIKVTDKIRTAAGITHLARDDASHTSLRFVGRYTHSSRIHFEALGDYGASAKNMPKANSLGLIMRYNF